MSRQNTLLTSHKGVDLHAASALLVMKDRLEGGDRLVNLLRCEMHTFWDEAADMARILDTGRYFNPNKHHYGHFVGEEAGAPWFGCADCRGGALPAAWPGELVATDLEGFSGGRALYDRLLGGTPAKGLSAVDVVAFPLGQDGPVLSGVLWRLLLSGDPAEAADIGHGLAVARTRKQGLLINPHMEAWLMAGTER
ncbi:hypothetical protein CSB20_08855 [bacterium DOLZORAL124_64_63]|nr:MAG: hypothetical protein CSB20_08855 [bacterium DOLZORAL124_64_63]